MGAQALERAHWAHFPTLRNFRCLTDKSKQEREGTSVWHNCFQVHNSARWSRPEAEGAFWLFEQTGLTPYIYGPLFIARGDRCALVTLLFHTLYRTDDEVSLRLNHHQRKKTLTAVVVTTLIGLGSLGTALGATSLVLKIRIQVLLFACQTIYYLRLSCLLRMFFSWLPYPFDRPFNSTSYLMVQDVPVLPSTVISIPILHSFILLQRSVIFIVNSI